MSKITNAALIEHQIQNDKMLRFAKQIMSEEQFGKLYDSYKQLFWFQLSLPIASALIIALSCLIFRQYAYMIFLFGSAAFIFLFIFWLILSQFLVGRLWHKYVKLYNSGRHPNVIIFDLFGS